VEAHRTIVAGDPLLAVRPGVVVIDVEALYRAHARRLIRLATAITLDRDRAEEIVQDAFAGLHRRRESVINAEAYLQRSVVNLSVKVLRRRATAKRHALALPQLSSFPEIDTTWAAVCRLPVRQRAVVALRYWEDLAEVDIAEILGWPPGTVKSTLHRALERLRKELAP